MLSEKAYDELLKLIASGHNFAPIHPRHDLTLQMPAHLIGVVRWVGESYLSVEHIRPIIRSWELEVAEVSALWDKPFLTNQLARVLCADVFHTESGLLGQEGIVAHRAIFADVQQVSAWLEVAWLEGSGQNAQVVTAIHEAVHRRLYITEEGILGFAPLETCPGDFVFVLSGGRTPFILRKEEVVRLPEAGLVTISGTRFADDKTSIQVEARIKTSSGPSSYTVVGACYADGFIDGEAVQLWRKERTFPSSSLSLPRWSQWPSLRDADDDNFDDISSISTEAGFRGHVERTKHH